MLTNKPAPVKFYLSRFVYLLFRYHGGLFLFFTTRLGGFMNSIKANYPNRGGLILPILGHFREGESKGKKERMI